MATNDNPSDNKFGGITMPTKPSTGRIRKQGHGGLPVGGSANGGHSSSDDGMAAGYGKTEGSAGYTSHKTEIDTTAKKY